MTPIETIVFLDIDGVLNAGRNSLLENKNFSLMHRDNISAFNRYLTNLGDYEIILSSTWRFSFRAYELYDMMKAAGYMGKRLYDLLNRVDIFPKDVRRICEIDNWLSTHKGQYNNYVVIDDMDMVYYFGDKQILTDKERGFTYDQACCSVS